MALETRTKSETVGIFGLALVSICLIGACTSESGAWANAERQDTANGYCNFVADYPESEHIGRASEGQVDAVARALHESLRHFSLEKYRDARRALESASDCNEPLIMNNLAILAVIDEDFDEARQLLEQANGLNGGSALGDTVVFFVLPDEGGEGAVSVAAFSPPGLDTTGLDVFEPAPGGVFFPVGSIVTTGFPVWANTTWGDAPDQTPQSAIAANLDKLR